MRPIMEAVRRLAAAMHVLSGILLIGMMVTVLLDVISRGVFGASGGEIDFTFQGGVEIVSYGLLFMVLFTLPHSVSRSQIVVDLFTAEPQPLPQAIATGVIPWNSGFVHPGARCLADNQ